MQEGGNLVLYESDGNMDWETASSGRGNVRLRVQGDCKLLIQADSTRFPVWSAGPGSCGTKTPGELRVQDDGNVVFYSTKNEVLWELTTLAVGQELMSGERLKSPNGQYDLHMQGDGNLVLYDSNGNMDRETATSGRGNVRLAVQSDCKLVIYADSAFGGVVWSAGSSCGTQTPEKLTVQDDGNVVFYSAQNEVLWDKHRWKP
jgi:hypothetical protein